MDKNKIETYELDRLEQEKLEAQMVINTLEDKEEGYIQREIRRAPIWVISIAFHCFVLFILTLLTFAMPPKKREDIIVSTKVTPNEKPPYNPNKERRLFQNKKEVKVDVEVDAPPVIVDEDVEVDDHFETDTDMDMHSALGDEDAISNIPLSGKGLVGTIGIGGGGGGSFGNRMGGGRKRCVMRGGGNRASESAVEAALRWLARHQEPDGHWDAKKYGATRDCDAAMTGLALLAFLGAGHTEFVGKYRDNVRRAVKWLAEHQKPDGSYIVDSGVNYTHGICLMAMAEAVGMGGSSMARESALKAIDFCLKQQNSTGCWNYRGPSTRNDMSLTGWNVMGLKSSLVSGLRVKEIKEAFRKLGAYLDTLKGTTGDNDTDTKGLAWYSHITGQMPKPTGRGSATQAIAMLVRQFLGWRRNEPWLMVAADGQISKIPKNPHALLKDVYRIYYACLTLFQMGGKWWKAWNQPVRDMIIQTQRKGDPSIDGSWDPEGLANNGGRVMSTAMFCLCLEVYYRYASLYDH